MDDLLQILKAAAEPTRLRLLALCARTELTVSDLTQILGQSQPRVSRHLKLLCDCGLLDRSREGTFAFFRLSEKGRATALAHILVDAIPQNDATLALDLERLDTIRRSRADAALAYFRDNAERWHEIRALHVPEREVEAALAALFPESVEDMVDIGTGTGRMLEILGPRCRHAVGVDLSREMLSIARAKLEAAGLRQCHVRQADIYQLPFPAASFDAAVVHQVLHFAEDPAGVVAEAARVLRPGGRLLMVDFAPHELEALRTDHAHRRLGFADGEVAEWCRQAGLTMAPPVHLPGDPLTVSLWTAERPAASPLSLASTVTGAAS